MYGRGCRATNIKTKEGSTVDVILKEPYGKITAISLGVIYDADGKDKLTGTPGDSPFVEGDVKLSKDGAEATTILTADLPAFAANGYELEWTPGEDDMDVKRLSLSFKDQDAPAFLSWNIELRTIGNSAAYYPYEGVDIIAPLTAEHNATQAAIVAHETARANMWTALAAEHEATQTAVAQLPVNPVYVIGADGSVTSVYAKHAGIFEVYRGDGQNVPFVIEGDLTGADLYCCTKESNDKGAPFNIDLKPLTGYQTEVIEGVTYTSGLIPFTYAETKDLDGDYHEEIKAWDGVNDPVTCWWATVKIKPVLADKADLIAM